MSFVDKLSCGAALMIIQEFTPDCQTCEEKSEYYKHILSFVCGGAALLGLSVIAILYPMRIGKRWKQK
jgi:hypothetical protein